MIEKAGSTVASVAFAIERASAKTGTDFDYLLKTAVRESSLDPSAKAGSSSAAGLFQFIEQTWFGMIKNHGAEHGLGDLAEQISRTKSGRYVVADRQVRRDILALRYDAEIAATMAGEFTKESQEALRSDLGREPTGGELYAAHFLGPEGASDLIRAAQRGEASAAALFPDAARSNRSIFYTKSGVARSPAEVLAVLTAKHNNADLPDAPAVADGVMLARIRGSSDTMDDVVKGDHTAVPLGRPIMDDGSSEIPPAALAAYTSSSSPAGASLADASFTGVQTPFMAQLLASLDPIPDRAREAIYQAGLDLRRSQDDRRDRAA
ncbi:MAG: lytic transglycosylase domain-containing protein [Alphaproteobacteria bacterium]|nr:lytic transglycosylase domain-containing protein [Alphaproteobacteria bacterium]